MTRARAVKVVTLSAALLAACLSRPVVNQEPTTKASFITNVRTSAVDKLDILLAIDNSSSMGDKQLILAKAIPKLISRLVTPNCVPVEDHTRCIPGSSGGCLVADVTKANVGQQCPAGAEPEFRPIADMHIGIVSSSLGSMGADGMAIDACKADADPTRNDHGELVSRSATNTKIDGVSPQGFAVWSPRDASTGIADKAQLESVIGKMVRGVGQTGCGVEAQLESVYKFLVMPDPWQRIAVNGGVASYDGLDETLLAQRKAFLRPDSLVAIVMLTDEDDSSADPLALSGKGWTYQANTPSAKPTAACASNPSAKECSSCGFDTVKSDPACQDNGGKYKVDEDALNVRFFHMKERFGVDPQYPLSRYVTGLRSPRVPDRASEHDGFGTYIGTPKCTNPLFASKLYATDAEARADGADLCNLPRGTRGKDLVYFAVVGGVPNSLLFDGASTDTPQRKKVLDWTKIVGKDPLAYDYGGQDPHMQQSIGARAGLTGEGVAIGVNGDDPVNGREWDTNHVDLQYACTFPLSTSHFVTTGTGEAPNADGKPGYYCGAKRANGPTRTAGVPEATTTQCDCDGNNKNPPLCDKDDVSRQVRAKAYPTVRELTLAKLMDEQGIAASLCPLTKLDAKGEQVLLTENPDDALFGYNPAVSAIVERLSGTLTDQCLPDTLTRDEQGRVPCVVVATLPAAVESGDPEAACETADAHEKGLKRAQDDVVANVRKQQSAETSGASGADLSRHPICEVAQLVVPQGASCKGDEAAGWCYVQTSGDQRPAGAKCGRAILFSARGNPAPGVRVDLQCINQFSSAQASGEGH